MKAHHLGARQHTLVFAVLMVLFIISFLISFVPLGAWSTTVAIGIGFVKAILVVLFFMHVIEARTSIVLAIVAGLLLSFLLLALMIADVELRPAGDYGEYPDYMSSSLE